MKRFISSLAGALLLAVPAAAQRDDDPLESIDVGPAVGMVSEDERVNQLFEEDLSGFDDEMLAELAKRYVLEQGQYTRGRIFTEELLRRDADSIPGHLLHGIVQHLAEGNLPRALFHVKRSRQVLEKRYGSLPIDRDMMFWHLTAILETAEITGAMGLQEEKIFHLREYNLLYSPPMIAQLGWPLMRLRRYGAARAAVEEALRMTDRSDQLAIARTALCAIEAEQQKRQESWEACSAAAVHERREARGGGPTPFTNAAEAALGVLRFDDAENLIHEGTKRFQEGTVSNPWLDLTHLYVAEGRIGEALDSVREMFRWRRRQPAHIDEQNRAETELTSAFFLLVAGHPEEASRVTARILERPDRTGYTSSETEQMEAGNALTDSVADRMAAELAAERASWSPFWEAAKARAEAAQRRLAAWSSGRRVASLVAAPRILLATVRPYLAGSMEIPEWLEPEIVRFLGPGVVAAAVDRARAVESLPDAEGYFLAYEAEIAFRGGRWREALARADRALEALPGSEQLLRARVAALGAHAAKKAGAGSRSLELFDQAMQLEPGVIRRLGLALPVAFDAPSGGLAAETVSHLEKSPRFDKTGRGWFRIEVRGENGSGEAFLFGPQGTRYGYAQVSPRAGDDKDAGDPARRLARELHEVVFAPRIDLTQADLRSLDGSPTAGGGRSSERLRSVLSDLVGLDEEDG
jgi:tetratricopeptide (TPR) repeat protein